MPSLCRSIKQEYEALQTLMPDQPTTLDPMDTTTWTRFITLPISGGCVMEAGWNPGNRQLWFAWDGAVYRDLRGGFRLAVRVEL